MFIILPGEPLFRGDIFMGTAAALLLKGHICVSLGPRDLNCPPLALDSGACTVQECNFGFGLQTQALDFSGATSFPSQRLGGEVPFALPGPRVGGFSAPFSWRRISVFDGSQPQSSVPMSGITQPGQAWGNGPKILCGSIKAFPEHATS